MFGVRSECNILEAVYENDVFKYKFYDIYNPTINPAQKIYIKNVYSSVLSLHLKKLDEIVKHKKGFNEIKNIGIILHDLLIPEGLVQFILQIKGSLNILSEEQEIPWELLHDGEDFFGIKYNIGRTIAWNSDVKMNKYVQNGEKTCLIISNPSKDLDYASEESLNLLKLFRKNGVKCRYLGCGTSADKILNVLSNNKYDFIHYSGHITKKNDEYVFVLNNDEFFSINMIKNLDIGNPLVYLNGCISAKIDKLNNNKNINRNFEGAVLPFILAGALGVIGSLWEITDVGSKNFSEIFYNNLINGYSIGESLKKSRFLNLDNNSKDYIWASFIYYGHPGLHYNFGGSCYITKELTNLVDPRISYNVTLSQDVNWNNFNDQIIDLLNCAAKIAQDSKVITSVHLIYAFSESYPILFDELCEKYNVYRNKFKVKLDRAIKKHEKKMENNFKKTIDLSQNINYEIRKLDNLKNKKGIIISIENFIIGVIDLKNSSVRDLLKGSLNDFNVNNNNIESSNINKDNINEYEIYNRQTKNGSSKVFLECISESLLKSISYALDYSSIRKISTTDLFIGMLENKELNIEKILIESEVDISRIKNYFKIHKHKKIDRIKILDLNSIYKDMFSKNVMEIMSKEVSESILNERFISEIQILKIILSNYCSLSKIFYELEIDVKRIMKVIDEF